MRRDINEVKNTVNNILESVNRKGMEKVIKFINENDFFTAPGSSRYHANYEGGLAEHSLNVYELLRKKNEDYELGLSADTVAVAALLHDICKVNFYVVSTRNVKKDGKWIQVPYYAVEEDEPLGHGEKSVIILQCMIPLTKEEMYMIRWHMGGFEAKENYNSMSNAFNKYPAALALHTADMEASYLFEEHVEV